MSQYWFFLSYARRNSVENNHVERFYRDLALAVGRSAGIPSDVGIERIAALVAAVIISYRFGYPAPDILSFSILTLLWLGLIFAGSLFFPLGRRWVRSANRRVMIHLVSLLAVCGLFQALPGIALRYNNEVFQQNEVREKIKLLTRAVALNPEYAEAHYNLAAIFEDLPDQEKAILEYLAAVRADPRFYQAHNNLARLLIHRGEYGDALNIINSAFEQNPRESSVRYTLFKNRCWAHLGLKLYDLADTDLKEATKLDDTRAAAHCLRAQLLEARKDFSEAMIEWRFCQEFWSEDEKGLENAWRSTAQERLKSGGPQ